MRVEIASPTWLAVKKWAAKEHATAQESNNIPGLDMLTTEIMRSRMVLLDELLKLPEKNQ